MVRFLCLQGTVMVATVLASRIGEGALVANHIALLVWMSTNPLIDSISVVCAPLAAEMLSQGRHAALTRHLYQLAAVGLVHTATQAVDHPNLGPLQP